MTRTHVPPRRLVLVLVLACLGAAWSVPMAGALGTGSEPEPVPGSASRYVVQEGDTVWSIVQRLRPGQDPRPAVDAILAVNDVDAGGLVPGQVLVLPASP